jgi:hypothetical protein
MAFDFPNSPALNDTYTPVGGPTYQWNGTVWLQVASPLIVVPLGRCCLDLAAPNLKLSRFNGRYLFINGVNEVVPVAGVTLAPGTMTAHAPFFIYA